MEATEMNPNRALWEKGDFTRIAETMRRSGDELVEAIGVETGIKVLDLGCGDGTTALPAAERGADVLGVDIASNLVAAGNERARRAGLDKLHFEQGDASDLSRLADGSFDLVVSIFGAMFAPRPYDVARQMVRVTRPGGRIVMGNWIPGHPTLVSQILKVCANYTPPPPEGFVSPMSWGDEKEVALRFENAGVNRSAIAFERAPFTFRFPGPPEDFLALFRDYYGPTMNAYDAAASKGFADKLDAELEALFRAHNRGGATTEIEATFLKVTVRKAEQS